MNGIDVSMYQKDIEFSKIPDVIKYIYIKATEGVNYVNPSFIALYNKVKTTNKLYGFYHFMSEKTDPSQQAIDFYNAIKDKSYILIPVLDIESNVAKRSRSAVTDRALQFLRKFKELSNIDCIVYTYTSFANSYLDKRLSSYKCWIADYNKSQTVKPNYVWSNFVGHQYSGSGRISGYRGNIDLDNFTTGIEMTTVNNVVGGQVSNESTASHAISILQGELNKQFNANLVIDNIAGPKTLNACIMVREGARGNITRWIQSKLNSLGYNCGSTDGIFGSRTKEAVVKYQRDNKLVIDGIVGKNTWRKLL